MPGTFNICIYQGATYNRTFIWNTGQCCGQNTAGASYSPVDLTGYTVAMQFRPWILSNTLLYDASTDITLGGVAGTISLVIPAPATDQFNWFSGVYDLLLTDSSGNVTPLLSGTVTVTPAVTQVADWTADSISATADSASYTADGA